MYTNHTSVVHVEEGRIKSFSLLLPVIRILGMTKEWDIIPFSLNDNF